MPNVELIDYTGIGHVDQDYAAKLLVYIKNTRLEQGEETRRNVFSKDIGDLWQELQYISKTIRSSWEFVDYTFEIRNVTRAFTHQLVRTRTASFAQQAQRVVDMSGFNATKPDSVKSRSEAEKLWDGAMEEITSAYGKMKSLGVPTEDCRGVLPTNVHTNIITKMNLRTLADVVGKRQNLRAQGEYGEVVKGMVKQTLRVHRWAEPFLYPERKLTPALDAIFKEINGEGSPFDKPHINAALKEIDALKGTWG